MSNFNDAMNKSVASMVETAEVHTDTHLVNLSVKELPEGITQESLVKHVGFINESSVAAELAVAQIGIDKYPEYKHNQWDGNLTLAEGVNIAASVILKEEVNGEATYGVSSSFVDYDYSKDLTNFYTDMHAANATRAAALFATDEPAAEE